MATMNKTEMEMMENAAVETAEAIDETTNAAEIKEQPPVEETPASTEEVKDSAKPADSADTRRTPSRSRPRRKAPEDASENLDYMGGYVKVSSPLEEYRQELSKIQSIINNNIRVAREGRGKPQFITAMMTADEEVRTVANDPNSVTAVNIFARQLLDDGKSLGVLNLQFDSNDFTAYSGLNYAEGEPENARLRRQRQYTSRAACSKFLCAPLKIVKSEKEGEMPKVICSRAFAMEYVQNQYFFGPNPSAKEGGHGIAYIMASYPHGVRVEFGGIEVFIPRGQLTSRRMVTDASKMYEKGTGIDVAITRLNVNVDENDGSRTIDIRLSGVQREVDLGLVYNVKNIDLSHKPRHMAETIIVTDDFYVVRVVDLGVIGLIPHDNVLPAGSVLEVGSVVWMEITGVNEETNRVIGSCYKM